ncbi:MAG: zinc ribbon domain-containing protein [Vicinamibacterales bacterium]
MPLFEYRCQACGHDFEALVRAGQVPPCPACGATTLERLPSLFAVDSEAGRAAARERSMPKAVNQHREKEAAEIEDYRRHHH